VFEENEEVYWDRRRMHEFDEIDEAEHSKDEE
jgi:hypothetical protein